MSSAQGRIVQEVSGMFNNSLLVKLRSRVSAQDHVGPRHKEGDGRDAGQDECAVPNPRYVQDDQLLVGRRPYPDPELEKEEKKSL